MRLHEACEKGIKFVGNCEKSKKYLTSYQEEYFYYDKEDCVLRLKSHQIISPYVSAWMSWDVVEYVDRRGRLKEDLLSLIRQFSNKVRAGHIDLMHNRFNLSSFGNFLEKANEDIVEEIIKLIGEKDESNT